MKPLSKQQWLTQLRWRCRRGMLECDLPLNHFLDTAFDTLSDDELELFSELLTAPDPELYTWLIGHSQHPNPKLQELVDKIRFETTG